MKNGNVKENESIENKTNSFISKLQKNSKENEKSFIKRNNNFLSASKKIFVSKNEIDLNLILKNDSVEKVSIDNTKDENHISITLNSAFVDSVFSSIFGVDMLKIKQSLITSNLIATLNSMIRLELKGNKKPFLMGMNYTPIN